ncbi:MAG: TIGR00730 family Rossman fold protein [Pseudomonadota bacterium]|nr:TIGR00730 family Rossman fold protein [Pseudomonadota bacterium]
MMQLKSICVFCGARNGNDPSIRQMVSMVGEMLAEHNISIVFGGSNRGLMGVVTNAALSKGGKVIGVLPDVLEGIETVHPKVDMIIRTPCLATRKQKMMDIADAFLILPGGYGTLDELYEILVLRKIKTNQKPIILFNPKGFWNDTLSQIRHLVREGFVSDDEQLIFKTVNSLQSLNSLLEQRIEQPA